MLPSGKFPRFALFAALLAVLLFVYDLEIVRNALVRLLFSNTLDTFVVALAALSSFYVGYRSSGYARQVWILLAVALSLETIGQALTTYYQSYVPGSSFAPQPSDLFFFVWAAPIFMILLPRCDERTIGFDYLRLLDFLQIAIVAVAAYLYFFYFSSGWKSDRYALLRGILYLYIARDLLLSVAFFFRSRSSQLSWFRLFCGVLALAFLAGLTSDADYLFNLSSTIGSSTWADLLWMVPSFLVIGLTVFWKADQVTDTSPFAQTRAANLLNAQIFPILMPLLVIFMARVIAREHTLLAWVIVTASVLCSSVRLILTNRSQRRTADELLSAEKALHRSEQLFASAFRASPDGFSINIFPNGPYLDVNDGFTRLTGYTREETINRTPLEMNLWVHPDDRAKILPRLISDGEVHDVEFQFRTKDGRIRIGQMSGSVLNLDGRQCSLIAVRDVTARKAAEELLRTNEQRFRSLVDKLHVCVNTFDPQGCITFANQASLDLFGMTREQIVGKTPQELGMVAFREDATPIPESDRLVPKVISTGQPVLSQLHGWRLPGRPDVIWTLLDAIPEFDSAGELFRIVSSYSDVTEQRRATEALRESEERFRTLVHDLHVGVVLHNPDGSVQFANRAALGMFGLTAEQAIGKVPSTMGLSAIDSNGRPIPTEKLPAHTVFRTKLPAFNQLLGWRRPGNSDVIWIFGNAVPQFAPDGSILRVISSFSDITEMKNAERSIHQLSTELLKLQDDERRRIGRELHDGMAQTVLAVNLSLAQIRQSSQPLSATSTHALDKARELLQQMSREIRTLSYLLHPPLLDDLGLVTALKEYVNGFSERSGIETSLEVQPRFRRLPQIVETAFFRITQESLSNIQRHSGSKRAKVTLREDAEFVTLEITDYGQGINVPVNGEPRRTPPRLGVGIPGMRERMAQLGGYLDIESNSSGTTVRARILLAAPALKEAVHDESASAHRG